MIERIRVLVIDDHPLFREGVVATLRASGLIEIVGQGATAEDAVRISREVLPDVLLLDLGIPGNGMTALNDVVGYCPSVNVVVLTASEADSNVSAALEAGAKGYVLKGIEGSDLTNTILAIHGGESYVTPRLAARLLNEMRHQKENHTRAHDAVQSLTNREEDILDCVSTGMTNKEIARRLNIAEKTVKHYMTNIMHKLQVRNRVEAVLANKRLGTNQSSLRN